MNPSIDQAKQRLIFALDVPDLASAAPWLERLQNEIGLVKIGLELFTREGPAVVTEARRRNIACFLDLKLHDIPATVEAAVRNACRLDIRMLTVHIGGGAEMLRRAQAAAGDVIVLGVTLLTSLDQSDLDPMGLVPDPTEVVRRRTLLARQSGLRGLVASAKEAAWIRKTAGPDLTLVVPGIRPSGASAGDQKRIATPRAAMAAGADYLVVGRPIRDASDPIEAARAAAAEIAEGLADRHAAT